MSDTPFKIIKYLIISYLFVLISTYEDINKRHKREIFFSNIYKYSNYSLIVNYEEGKGFFGTANKTIKDRYFLLK
jgi:hypothetical protein